ncbi:TonB-dependent receptor [Thalassotalea sp. 1_MG-2023]|uniref:TonB-dependent receptor plug domain-containing protein n=1 Tax=Thalassotalea sp. 1_MG-2023 TaxID=3062680 RepID=UPI0026E44A41|nr:TonB-dependent receptor [Thalassotalea sp. 1_MG-2023]MDO6428108.1 TonB-dependent receptor [Thalassotalea sp. 1_MG-2023]
MKKTRISVAIQSAMFSSVVAISGTASADENQLLAEVEAQSSSAQSSSEKQVKEDKPEKITVTGSRLRRDSFSVATPLATMDREAIEDTGIGSLSDILIDELPQLSEGTSNSNSQSSVQNTGLSTIDLRELGTNRTLTLIDGRRVVSNSYSGNYVSLSTIPSGMVDRVEVITGGASAAYGSDAIAGVVNIITKKDAEGFSFKARGGESTDGGAREYGLDMDFGTDIADGRGSIFLATSYDREFGLDFEDRSRAQQQDSWDYDDDLMCNVMLTETGDQCMRDITKADWRSLSDSIPGGVFDEESSTRPDAGFWYDQNGLRDDWHEERYGINTNQFVMLRVPDEKASAAVKVDYDLTDDTMFYGQLQYSYNRSINDKAPESEDECDLIVTRDSSTGEFGEDCIGRIPKNNPFMPEEIRDQASSSGVKWDRNFAEVGNIVTDNTRRTIRSWAGLQGTMFDGEWDWDLSVGFGKFEQRQRRFNELYVSNVRNALDVESDGNGGYQCVDATARGEGCVPLNLFGEGAISDEAADYIRANPTINTDIEQFNMLGYMAGDLFEMPAGMVSSVFGFEYRKDSQEVSTNVPDGGVTFNYVPDFKGDLSVAEVFAEAAFPLLKDVEGAKNLSAEVSVRLAEYDLDNIDLVQSYKAGLVWEPIEGYAVRANWARAQRAPTITEAMSPPRGDYDSFDDICDGVTATSTDEGHANCRQIPGIAAEIAAEGQFDDENSGYSPNVGNADLFEETAETVTLGITMAPAFLDGFRMAIDYYDISIEDAITSFGNEDIIEFCYNSSLAFGSDNPFCNDVQRDPTDGQIIGVMQRLYNQDEISTSGYDVAAEYRFDLNEYGNVKIKADWTHVISYQETKTSPDGQYTTDYTGSLSADVFQDAASASVTWYKDSWRVRWSMKYKSDVVSSKSLYDDFYEPLDAEGNGGVITEYYAACAEDSSVCVDNPEKPYQLFLPSYVRNDVSVSYSTDLSSGAELRLFGGVNNVFDNNGPFILGGKGNYDSSYGGGKGRFIYAGAEIKF